MLIKTRKKEVHRKEKWFMFNIYWHTKPQYVTIGSVVKIWHLNTIRRAQSLSTKMIVINSNEKKIDNHILSFMYGSEVRHTDKFLAILGLLN